MKVYNVIMAGGGGTRFWPLSRQEVPKQLINLSGEDALINETINRIDSLANKEDLFIVTNEKQMDALKDTVKDKCLYSNILPEPCARNTAAAIGFAAFNIMKKYGDGVMCVYPADHYIKDEKEFKAILEKAIYIAENNDKLVTIGINPTFPSTGYGYINFSRENTIENVAYEVVEFVEKPNYEIAKEYVNSKKYVWNSGMFVWKVSKILEDFKRYLPKVYEKLEEISNYLGTEEEIEKIREIYPTIQSISIDYGIMERSNDVIVVPGDFGWNDVGSWDSLGAIYPTDDEGNIKRGENITIDTKNSIIYSDDKLISTIGISDLIVVSTNDAVMVCRKDKAQDVKKIVEQLKEEDRQEYM
ncbi:MULTISPECIES: mannose-1-phosphate guanylyltransferase [unclassified Clostridioides]|uniref:mannose-1-phosphate guanylyltransferase n=1 Tax=unclassified Clostridioides TaxID=2635829 RepID=UPI001D12F43C|nr:mannose-1-phosphate guanylyltransferase [Clostridioides sp. ES-S-0001-02]MCC0639467.1 mannose-1-phosphate guanylyltransferase [Clostridioides sp. ES-S-0049-03]MCC0655712.1 mannose-1-phosphate guanylyltransferase [Clostridioides sp. ES-S-0123-01]MCC0674013.1 mannose-1-phosphate guanylyltransferase [Clostridioides sp. ES-S-0145-01]MCC0676607.1 mannose-1-phosphate guanylyltransferase [Clostridioides sp. ES-W-0018-02]MCC0711192.1 mannose-1-phosphate guanylyltransferase [Clostridioides sp. ES-W-